MEHSAAYRRQVGRCHPNTVRVPPSIILGCAVAAKAVPVAEEVLAAMAPTALATTAAGAMAATAAGLTSLAAKAVPVAEEVLAAMAPTALATTAAGAMAATAVSPQPDCGI